jgi:hypothetical protein
VRRASLLTALALAASPTMAQKIYRCGPDASTYSQQPCVDGKALDISDPRSAAQRREAREASAQNSKQADAMQRQREQAEHRSKSTVAGRLTAAPEPPASAAKPPKAAASKPTLYREPIKPKTSPP